MKPSQPQSQSQSPPDYRVEPQEGTAGMSKWRVVFGDEGAPTYIVKLLGATVAKMEELHHRKLTPEDIRVGVERAVARARRELEQQPSDPRDEISVMVRDSDLAELDGRVVGPTNDVPY